MNAKELIAGYDREIVVLSISLGRPEKGMKYIEPYFKIGAKIKKE
jgi:hypothetical protein